LDRLIKSSVFIKLVCHVLYLIRYARVYASTSIIYDDTFFIKSQSVAATPSQVILFSIWD
jgi:hypothetical protein